MSILKTLPFNPQYEEQNEKARLKSNGVIPKTETLIKDKILQNVHFPFKEDLEITYSLQTKKLSIGSKQYWTFHVENRGDGETISSLKTEGDSSIYCNEEMPFINSLEMHRCEFGSFIKEANSINNSNQNK